MRVSALKKLEFSQGQQSVVLPDISGYSISHLFSMFKTQQSTRNYCLQGRLWNGSTVISGAYYVFFDTNGKISLDSKVSATTTPTSTSLGALCGSNGFTIILLIDHIAGEQLSYTGTGGGALLVDSGTLCTENGEACLTFDGTEYFVGTSLSELDDTEDFSIGSVSVNGTTNTLCSVVSNSDSGSGAVDRIEQYNDRRTNKRIAVYRNDATTTYENTYSATQDVGTPKRLVTTFESGVEMKSYYNTTLQDTDAISGACDNDAFSIGGRNNSNILSGNWQCTHIHTVVSDSTAISGFDTILGDCLNF